MPGSDASRHHLFNVFGSELKNARLKSAYLINLLTIVPMVHSFGVHAVFLTSVGR